MSKENVVVTEELMVDEMAHEAGEEQDETEGMEQEEEEVDLSSFCPSSSSGTNARTGEAGALSIVNSEKNGKRITLSREVTEKLNDPETVQFSFSERQILIAEELPNHNNRFTVKKHGARGVIYSSSLVQEITERFKLDFSNRVSITLHEVKYAKSNGKRVAIITVK
jgi:hypothetical protein